MLKKLLPPLGIIVATAIWGSSFLVVKNSLAGIDAVTLVTYRFLLAAFIFGMVVVVSRRPLKNKYWHKGCILGVVTFAYLSLQALGVKDIPAAESAFLTGSFIAFVPVFGFVLFHKVPTGVQIASVLVALAGLWFLTGGLHDFGAGEALTLMNAVLIGLDVVLVDRFVKSEVDIIVLNFQQFLVVGILGIACMFVFHLPMGVTNTYALQAIFFLAFFATVIAFWLVSLGQKYLSPVTAGILLSTETLFGALVAWLFGGEMSTQAQIIGGVMVIAAIVISELPMKHVLRVRHGQREGAL